MEPCCADQTPDGSAERPVLPATPSCSPRVQPWTVTDVHGPERARSAGRRAHSRDEAVPRPHPRVFLISWLLAAPSRRDEQGDEERSAQAKWLREAAEEHLRAGEQRDQEQSAGAGRSRHPGIHGSEAGNQSPARSGQRAPPPRSSELPAHSRPPLIRLPQQVARLHAHGSAPDRRRGSVRGVHLAHPAHPAHPAPALYGAHRDRARPVHPAQAACPVRRVCPSRRVCPARRVGSARRRCRRGRRIRRGRARGLLRLRFLGCRAPRRCPTTGSRPRRSARAPGRRTSCPPAVP